MKTLIHTLTATLGVAVLAGLFPSMATAGCGAGFPLVQPSSWNPQYGQPRLLPAGFVRVGDEDRRPDNPIIVGFWHQQLISDGSSGPADGTVVDDDLAQWHSDNTEIQNTKSLPSISGNFCLGVWEQTGPRSFRLNHFPQTYDPTGTVYAGTAHLQEEVTVSPDGKRYSGTFTLDQYDPTGKIVLGHVQGTVTGTRITVNSTIADVL